ncbi:MAG: response regulator transcription factor [Aulosira sp. ZfuVER01]|nr:response regulator transcription factor [Aulosira sp. ZfuVER01]MDZ7998622.1 response regulator transcription factor [Aulosira sp. DedVER01a]MDZ8052033.1 response regulator transcription factor [Aulosira sp. ZfuCHP01]
MNTSQIERSEEFTNVTLFPSQSPAINQIKENWLGISALQAQTVTIRAIAPQKQKQILDHPLSERELCVLKMIVDGNSNHKIAQKLFITLGTVKTHVRHIFYKLNVTDRTQATVLALRSGLVD